MAIDLPVVHGGPETARTLSYWLASVFKRCKLDSFDNPAVGSSPSEGTLEMALVFPGSVTKPEFEGRKVGKYSKTEKRMQISYSVPYKLLDSLDFADYYFDCLESAIQIAKTRFDKDGIPFDLERHRKFVKSLRELDLNTAKALPWVEKLRGSTASVDDRSAPEG